MTKILLAADGSKLSNEAVNEVATRPFPPNTKVRIVSAYERTPLITRLEPMGLMAETYAQADHYALKAAQDASEDAAKVLLDGNPALTVTVIAIDGSAKSVILDEAEAFGADLVVVGSHGYGMVERFMLGSVSHAVALHAKCSVEIVRGAKSGDKGWKILLAIDGSEQSEMAVEELASQPFPAGSEVKIISVIEPPYFQTSYPPGVVDVELYVEMEKNERERALRSVEEAADKLRAGEQSGNLVTTKVLSGSPKREILEEADDFGADLIVVGSHGHGMFERFLLGSVSMAVALHAKCSVEIVRSPKLGQKR